MANKSSREAAKAKSILRKKQAAYSGKNRDKVAASGAAQRHHVAAAVLHVVFEEWKQRSPDAKQLLGDALDLLEEDGYDRTATWARMNVMRRQPRRPLTPPNPKNSKKSE